MAIMISASQWWPACFSEKVLSETLCMLSRSRNTEAVMWVQKTSRHEQPFFFFAAEVFTNERIPFNFSEQVSTGDGVSLWLCYSRPLTIAKRRVLFQKTDSFLLSTDENYILTGFMLWSLNAIKIKAWHMPLVNYFHQGTLATSYSLILLHLCLKPSPMRKHSSFLNTYCWTASP